RCRRRSRARPRRWSRCGIGSSSTLPPRAAGVLTARASWPRVPRRERDESRAVRGEIQAPPRRGRPVLTCPRGPLIIRGVAISAGPRQAFRGDVLVREPVLGRPRRSATLRNEAWLAWSLLTPALLVILALVAYPFFAAIYLSLQDKMVGAPGRFVGLDNYLALFGDDVFVRTAWNSVLYTVVAVALKFVLGLTMALVLDQPRRYNNVFRTLLF